MPKNTKKVRARKNDGCQPENFIGLHNHNGSFDRVHYSLVII
jgi:hypothetical protein